ncbi:hypothetical protein BGX21_011007 [Mortierella sp. AD011]|nr:hypothetical protein BGX20_005916 [Mortierella sp. AD010]KAF9392469.1 hypothetical protein BGX21_011007 [Mortierella sp. AD011]
MDNFSMALDSDIGLFDDCCDQSAIPSFTPHVVAHVSAANNTTFVTAGQTFGNNNSYSFPSNDLAAVTWDVAPTKAQLQQLFNSALSDTSATNIMDFTPELSPAMDLATPAANQLRSPFAFDTLGLDELGSSPSIGYQSPMDHQQAFGSQHSQESFDFDFGLDLLPKNTTTWPAQTDFDLFPENSNNSSPSVSSLEQLLMRPVLGEAELSVFEESPLESDLDYFSPIDSCAASPVLGDYTGLFGNSNEAATGAVSSGRQGSGFQPPKRRRRRRATTEDAARVFEDDENDPNARARYKCSVCEKTFSRPFNLRSHRATHAGVKPFVCSHVDEKGEACSWSFARRHDLERHMRSRHSGEKLFKCKTCGAECGRNDAFKRHLQRHAACGMAAMLEQQQQQQQQQNGA